MGEQAGVALSGELYFVPYREFVRVLSLPVSSIQRTQLFATLCRINTLYMIARAGSGHIGSSFSSLDVMSWLLVNEIRPDRGVPGEPADVFFSSKGHDAPALYSVYLGLGRLEFDLIHRLRRLGGLPGHPDVSTPNIVTNTGSLGMGVSKAKGMIFANRLTKRSGRVYVLTGDGELQEGQFWESLVSAANHGLHELTVIVDHNKLQSDTLVSKVSDLGDLEAKAAAFGWHVARCNGNDLDLVQRALSTAKKITDRPQIIIADTVKGKGVSFMEHTSIDSDVELYKFHSGAPTLDAYAKGLRELRDHADSQLASFGVGSLELEEVVRPTAVALDKPQRLVQAYSEALVAQARKNPKIVALDADLALDTGLLPFQKQFPERFVECGIAEQDMVSQAGGMALRGLLPIVHSFACFLSTRPNEQIYNNATERTKVVYVGSLAGVVPGGPGHSHQAVRDISALAGVPGLTLAEPSCEAEASLLLDWCVNVAQGSSYLRLVSIPCAIPYELPASYAPKYGCGVTLRQGRGVALIGYGPVSLPAAMRAADLVAERSGVSVKVVNLPWLNLVDESWLRAETADCNVIVSIDNHYAVGGQGDRLAAALVGAPGKRLVRIAISDIPQCGTNQEVLEAHGLDAASIADVVTEQLSKS